MERIILKSVEVGNDYYTIGKDFTISVEHITKNENIHISLYENTDDCKTDIENFVYQYRLKTKTKGVKIIKTRDLVEAVFLSHLCGGKFIGWMR